VNNKHLYSAYQRVKSNCCDEWKNSSSFYAWYKCQVAKQDNLCCYCHLPGDTKDYYGRHFRPREDKKGGVDYLRGHYLEVERKDNNQPYSPDNCVLACYPCNNAKSDVFSYEEFKEIGKAIAQVKTGFKV